VSIYLVNWLNATDDLWQSYVCTQQNV